MTRIFCREDGFSAYIIPLLWFLAVMLLAACPKPVQASEKQNRELTFDINSFYIEGNSVLEKEVLTMGIKDYMGQGKTAGDVEAARDALEKLYHSLGYPTVLVNIPEQTVSDGVVKFQVIESRIKRVRVKGNKYFTHAYLDRYLSGISPGEILYLPRIRKELARVNQNQDLKVSPLLIPGRELGTIDVELNVEDSLPLHGFLELNNRSTHSTTDLRLNGMISYDNLWQRGHAVSLQFQTSPEDTSEVRMFSLSYSMPSIFNIDHLMVGYYIKSDSETASGEGFDVIGNGQMAGFRYMVPLDGIGRYEHNIAGGFDFKDFNEDSLGVETPIQYLPFSIAYSGYESDTSGTTQFSLGINFLIRDFCGNDKEEFANKRYMSTGNYLYVTAGAERRQELPWDCSLFGRLDGQFTGQPLINNEQYAAGGVNSVRGYMESEVMADNALHGTLEVFAPNLIPKLTLIPYLFYDFAYLSLHDSLEGQFRNTFIHGTGLGVQGNWKKMIEYKMDWGIALKDTDDTQAYDQQIYFQVKWRF
nr:ShlB/FhaC/HecB family hemolysin secretion/activation protein [uncultured Desulfobacter sp.]